MPDSSTTTPPPEHDHPVRGRFNSWFLNLVADHVERVLGSHKEALFGDLSGEVLEIGPGNGPNLRYLGKVTRLHAAEPNPYFHDRLREEAERQGIEVVIHPMPGESLELPDDSIDAVISSWVLCTVAHPDAVIEEIRRVLKPGGRFVFVEHVRDRESRAVRTVQRVVFRPWRWMFEGCHLDRDTADVIRGHDWSSLEIDDVRVPTPFVPMRPEIVGSAGL